MDSKTKKIIGFSLVTAILSGAAFLAWQFNKILSYSVKVVGKRIYKISTKEVIFDLMVEVNNNSVLPIYIQSQLYNVYLNDSFITGVASKDKATFQPNSSTVFPLRITINPKDVTKALGVNGAMLLLTPEKIVIKIIFELKVKVLGINLTIKNTYPISLAELLKIKPTK